MYLPLGRREDLYRIIEGHLAPLVKRIEALEAAQTRRKWDEGEHEGCGIDSQRALEGAEQPQSPSEHGSWNDEDYNRARDCMIGLLRGRGWTISEGSRGVEEFDNAFQHAVGILALTITRPDRNTTR